MIKAKITLWMMHMAALENVIESAGVDLFLREPFFAHLLSSIPRLISEKVDVAGFEWARHPSSHAQSMVKDKRLAKLLLQKL